MSIQHLSVKPGRVVATLPDGSTVDRENVLDCMLTFHMHVVLNCWTPLVGQACGIDGAPWRVPHGLPLDADTNRGHLVVKPGYKMWVMAIATGTRHVQVQMVHKAIGQPTIAREFSGPLLKKSYALTSPIEMLSATPFRIEVGAADRRTSHHQGGRVQIDLACLFVQVS